MELNEIPVIVLEQVRNKWAKVKRKGDVDWTKCSMCRFLDEVYSPYASCTLDCPLYDPEWCTGDGCTSRISPDYIMYCDDPLIWLDAVQEFLDYINAEIDRRRDESCM